MASVDVSAGVPLRQRGSWGDGGVGHWGGGVGVGGGGCHQQEVVTSPEASERDEAIEGMKRNRWRFEILEEF